MINSLFSPELTQTLVQIAFEYCVTENSSSFETLRSWKNLCCVNLDLPNAKSGSRDLRRIFGSIFKVRWLEWIMLRFAEILRTLNFWNTSLLPYQVPHFGFFIEIHSRFKIDSSDSKRVICQNSWFWGFCGIHDLWFHSLHFPVVFQVCLKILWSTKIFEF